MDNFDIVLKLKKLDETNDLLRKLVDKPKIGFELVDTQDLKKKLDLKDGLPGKVGSAGKNGIDGKDGREGVDGKDGREGVDGKDGREGVDGKDGQDGSADTGEDIVVKINSTEKTIQAKNVAGLVQVINEVRSIGSNPQGGGGGQTVRYLQNGVVASAHVTELNFSTGTTLTYDGNGRLTITAAGGGGGGTPGGATTQIQYNNAGAFAGSSKLAWNNTTNLLTVGGGLDDATINYAGSGALFITATGTGSIVQLHPDGVKLAGGAVGASRITLNTASLTVDRTVTLPNKDGTVAMTSDITGGVTDGDKGDITVTATGATWTVDPNAVTNAKLAQMGTKTYKGRTSALTGNAEDVAVATLKTDLVLVKADVGLGSVDNTSDASKPVSTAQQTAIDAKVSDTAYNATSWDAVTTIAPSKNAVRDKIETIPAAYITVGATKADYITDGTADDIEINQAVQAAIAAGGGTVLIKAGTYNLAATIAINGNNVTLMGTGEGTKLKSANASNINPITVSGTGIINAKIKMMKIDCNRVNNTFGSGIQFNTPWSATDPNHVLEDLYIVQCKNNGIEFTASSDTRVPLFRNIHIQDCDGNGLFMPFPSNSDGIFENIICDRIGLNGLYIGGANHHFTNCKTFYCGVTAGNNHGFYINGYNNFFTNCEAQDNYQSGFYIDATGDATFGARGNTFSNCIADSNGQALNALYSAGWQIVNTPDTQIIGGIAMTRPYPAFTQAHGIRMTGTTTRTNVVGVWFSNNTNAWTDASSGTNYRSLCTGQSTELSTIPGGLKMGVNEIQLGTSTGKIYSSGTRVVIDGASQPLQLDNLSEIFYNFATPVIQMFNAAARTLVIKNDGGGAANLLVTNDSKSRTKTLIGATSGETILAPAAVASGTQTLPAGTGTLLSSATNLAANPVTGVPSNTNFLRGDGTWATPGGGSGITRVVASIAVNTTAPAVASTDYDYNATAALTLTLPTAVGNTNQYSVTRIAGLTTIATTSAQTINGVTSVTLPINRITYTFVSDGANWNIK